MVSKDYWEDLDVNYEYIKENWESHYKNKLKNYLKNLNDTDLFDMCEILQLLPKDEIKKDQKKTYVEILLGSKHALDIAMLNDFFSYKIDIINKHHSRLKEVKKVFYNNNKNSFLKLFEIFARDESELKNLLIYHYWYRNFTFSHTDYPSIPLQIRFIDDFESKSDQFIRELKKHNWKNLAFKSFGKISLEKK